MPRKGNVPKRDVLPDPRYGDKVVTKFMNRLMADGKKSKAEGVLYGAFDIIEEKLGTEPLKIFKKALRKCPPLGRGQVPQGRWRNVPGSGRG